MRLYHLAIFFLGAATAAMWLARAADRFIYDCEQDMAHLQRPRGDCA